MLARANLDQKMNIFQDRFTTGQVVAATGLPNHTLQSWLKRNMLTGNPVEPIEGGGTSGAHRKFSFFTVMEIAVAKALTDLGVSATDALKTAQHYAHFGRGPLPGSPERRPSLPYMNHGKAARTLICAAGGRAVEVVWEVGKDFMSSVRWNLQSPAFVIVEADAIFEHACQALGYDPREVMTFAYGGSSE